MRRIFLIAAATALAACNPPVDDTPGAFETFNASNITGPNCHFGVTRDASEAFFATDTAGSNRAFVRYKGETIKLSAVDDLSVDESGSVSALYFAIDYPAWDIVVDGEDIGAANMPPTLNLTVSLIQNERVMATSPKLIGSCAL